MKVERESASERERDGEEEERTAGRKQKDGKDGRKDRAINEPQKGCGPYGRQPSNAKGLIYRKHISARG